MLAGDDALALPAIALGAHGLISVVSNLLPSLTRSLIDAARASRFDEARAVHARLLPAMHALFAESNPVPLKAALALFGLTEETVRAPLAPASASTRARLEQVFAAFLEAAA